MGKAGLIQAKSGGPAEARIVSDFPGSATVSVACVGVSPTQRYAADKFTRSMAIRACR
jgi:hypothetical protein